MLNPELALALARQHQLDLIAEVDRHRLLNAARRRRRRGSGRIRQLTSRWRTGAGDALTTWPDHVAVPPR